MFNSHVNKEKIEYWRCYERIRKYFYALQVSSERTCKKRNQTEVQTFLSWYYMVPVGTSSYHDGTDDRIRYSVWKQRQDIPCIYPDRPSAVQLLFKFDDTRTEISPGECGDDQESLCAEVYLSAVKRTL